MDERIIKYYANELRKEERENLLKEALADSELKKQMIECQRIQSLYILHPNRKNGVEGEDSYRLFMHARQCEENKQRFVRFMRYIAILVLGFFIAWLTTDKYMSSKIPQAVTQVLTVPAGQRAHITLPDGSKVWVNAGSTLQYLSYFGDERRVTIIGEAFFEVAKDKEHPFIVSTGKMNVQATGTRFNVFNYPAHPLSVSLLEGSIRVYNPNGEQPEYRLRPNQQIIETRTGYEVSTIGENPVMWKEGLYAFKKQPLKAILTKLELYYDVKIIVRDPAILNCEYTGKFRQRDGIMEVLRLVRKIHPFKFDKDEDTNTITLYR